MRTSLVYPFVVAIVLITYILMVFNHRRLALLIAIALFEFIGSFANLN